MSPTPFSSHEVDASKVDIYSSTILLANLSSPLDYHVLESGILSATRATKDRLVIILHSQAFANQEGPRANWFEIQRLLTWTYVGSTAVAQDMDKVLFDANVLLRPRCMPTTDGTVEDEELVKNADVLYVFQDGASRVLLGGLSYRQYGFNRNADSDAFSWWISKSSSHILIQKSALRSTSHMSLPPDADKLKPSLPVTILGGTFDHLHAGHKILLSMAAWISQKKVIVGVTGTVSD